MLFFILVLPPLFLSAKDIEKGQPPTEDECESSGLKVVHRNIYNTAIKRMMNAIKLIPFFKKGESSVNVSYDTKLSENMVPKGMMTKDSDELNASNELQDNIKNTFHAWKHNVSRENKFILNDWASINKELKDSLSTMEKLVAKEASYKEELTNINGCIQRLIRERIFINTRKCLRAEKLHRIEKYKESALINIRRYNHMYISYASTMLDYTKCKENIELLAESKNNKIYTCKYIIRVDKEMLGDGDILADSEEKAKECIMQFMYDLCSIGCDRLDISNIPPDSNSVCSEYTTRILYMRLGESEVALKLMYSTGVYEHIFTE